MLPNRQARYCLRLIIHIMLEVALPQKRHYGAIYDNIAEPEGLQESSRWSESAETTGKVVSHDRTPKGCQTSQ